MMEMMHDRLFGPLSKDYCYLFYIFMVFNFLAIILVVLAIISETFLMKKIPYGLIASELGFLAICTVLYLENRILHTMCMNVN